MANMAQGAPSTLTMQVASEIRALMARRGMTAVQLGRLLGYSHPWVSERLRGERSISVADLEKIAEALEVQVLDLFPRTQARSTDEALATIGLDQFTLARRLTRRQRRVTGEYPQVRPPVGRPDGRPDPVAPRRPRQLVA